MAVRPIGGYDPDTGQPIDDSTGIQWQDDVTLPKWQGGGQGFGPGGFQGSPRLTAPASGPPPGVSLSANPHGDGPTPINPDEVIPPNSRPIAPNRQVGPFTGGSATENVFPQPQGPGGWMGMIPGLLSRFGVPAAAIGAGVAGIQNENQPGNVPAHGTGPQDVMSPEEIYRRQHGPPPSNVPQPGFQQPAHPSTMRYPSWPTPPAPTGVDATIPPFTARGQPSRPVTPTPATAYPASPVATPAVAGPAAARQQPNLGNYSPFTTVSRPNANPGIGGGMLGGGVNSPRGQGGAPLGTALDLSRLFGGGQPAPAAAAPVRAPVAAPVYRQPSIRMIPPAIPIGGGAGNVMEAPTGTSRRKGSSSSQGGGY